MIKHPTMMPVVFAALVSILNFLTWFLIFLFAKDFDGELCRRKSSPLKLLEGEDWLLSRLDKEIFLKLNAYLTLLFTYDGCNKLESLTSNLPAKLHLVLRLLLLVWVPWDVTVFRWRHFGYFLGSIDVSDFLFKWFAFGGDKKLVWQSSSVRLLLVNDFLSKVMSSEQADLIDCWESKVLQSLPLLLKSSNSDWKLI